jgi:uncharacterized membrane protein SpoIIM required for sporulation
MESSSLSDRIHSMDANQLYQSHQADWETLSGLLDRAEQDIGQLSPAEIGAMGRLYRVATSDLALAQRDFPRNPLTVYLNQLVARGHAVIYRSEPFVWRRIRDFVFVNFPRVYRETLPFTLTAAFLFFLPALMSMAAVWLQPDASFWLLPPQVQELREQIEGGQLWVDIPAAERPYTSSFIMRNNIQVAFLAFAGGMLAGVFTMWVLINNGLLLGSLTGLTAAYGLGFDLWTFVIGHGVIELSVIVMAGGAGLRLGWAILPPGLLRRQDSLKVAAARTVGLIIGCVPLLIIAGVIEGFVSPADNIPALAKWLLGLGSGVILYGYLLLAGYPVRAVITKFAPLNPGSD